MRYRLPWLLVALLVLATLMTMGSAAVALASPEARRMPITDTLLSATPALAVDGSCPAGVRHPAVERLPELAAPLAGALRRYEREAPAGASTLDWYDSGGRFGGGVPVQSVKMIMREGLAFGLSQGEVASFLNPGFLRGVSDPYGGGGVLAFIVERGDKTLLSELAAYSGTVSPSVGGPMEAQRSLFQALPLLNVVYEAQAGVPPLDETSAATMTDLAESGYQPAQRAIGGILAAGNHPSAGAQESGSVADQVQPSVYDYFVDNYGGPLSQDARVAVANRNAYLAWVDRIAAWTAGGTDMEQVPVPATFPAQPVAALPLATGLGVNC